MGIAAGRSGRRRARPILFGLLAPAAALSVSAALAPSAEAVPTNPPPFGSIAAPGQTLRAHSPVAEPAADGPSRSLSLAVSSDGRGGDPVVLVATVSRATTGQVTFYDGPRLLGSVATVGASATLTTTRLGPGPHRLSARLRRTGPGAKAITSRTVTLSLSASACPTCSARDSLRVVVPVGFLAISSPYTPVHPLDLGTVRLNPDGTALVSSAALGDGTVDGSIKVVDTRPGDADWSVTAYATDLADVDGRLISGEGVGLTGVHGVYLSGNALQHGSISLVDNRSANPPVEANDRHAHGLGNGQHVVARSLDGGDGTVGLTGRVGITAPTSTRSGAYSGTIVFTVS
jgi:hypothetical protein